MKIGFAGAGKAGFTLAKYMSVKGVSVSGFFSRSIESAKAAAHFTHTEYFDTLEEIAKACDALFLTVPDGAIGDIWDLLKKLPIEGKCICHTSGVKSADVFTGIEQTGAYGYSIHPLFAINSKEDSYLEISNAYFAIEGAPGYLAFWKEFFEKLGNPVVIIKPEQKILYHCAAVFASNLTVGLFETAAELLTKCGFDEKSARDALKPLFLYNCQNIADSGPMMALTGPVERADAETIRLHLQSLSELSGGDDFGKMSEEGLKRNEEISREKTDLSIEEKIYRDLSKILIDIAKRKNPERDYSEISNIL